MNIDILGMHPDLYWDLRVGIPFPDGCAQAVFLEHVLEHFHARGRYSAMLEECYRVLGPAARSASAFPTSAAT